MLEISNRHTIEACAAFAARWLDSIAAYDLAGAEAMIDANDSGGPFAQSFPPPEGFTYCRPDKAASWDMHIVGADENGLCLDFEVPFVERNFRPMMARFDMERAGAMLKVRFLGLTPS